MFVSCWAKASGEARLMTGKAIIPLGSGRQSSPQSLRHKGMMKGASKWTAKGLTRSHVGQNFSFLDQTPSKYVNAVWRVATEK
jgi:hypothetical protein